MRNIKSVPNSPMFDVSIHFDKNSLMEKLYLHGMSYDEAIKTTFKGKSIMADIIRNLVDYNTNVEKMNDEDAYKEALRIATIITRNLSLKNNMPTNNEYAFLTNYYNKYIDKSIRSMMKLDINLYFLKEAMKNNPNLSFYVRSLYNRMIRIQGIVSSREENIILTMYSKKNKVEKYEFTYSLGSHTLVNHSTLGFIEAKKLPLKRTRIKNLMFGNKHCKIEKRYKNEIMYDMVLDNSSDFNVWIDAMHNTFISPNYSNPKNLIGKDIIC